MHVLVGVASITYHTGMNFAVFFILSTMNVFLQNRIVCDYRLSGAALVVPFVHYWWPCLPADLAKEGFERLLVQDRWVFRVARYAPWLFQWWMNQKLFPSLSFMDGKMDVFCQPDLEFLQNLPPPDDNQVTNYCLCH